MVSGSAHSCSACAFDTTPVDAVTSGHHRNICRSGTSAVTQSNPPSSDSPDDPQAESAHDSPAETAEGLDAGGAWTASGEDLPDIEELTPELVEEEAIRGDFMLRGAAILLAVLFGFGQISDSRVLVHVRSGEQMRSDGFLPPRTDPFSFANEGESTANVSWLFDHIVSGVWSVGDQLGLTLFKGLIAGFIAWLLGRISVPGLPTWWNSVCVVIALGACASDLMPITDLMTLLGLSILLWLLHRAYGGHSEGLVWKAPLLIAVWCNLDPHAWIGVVALLLFTVGTGFAATPGETRPSTPPGTMWVATALSAVALLINPFPLTSALSVLETYLVEYPGMQALYPLRANTIPLLDGRVEYYSLLNMDAWGGFEFSFIAALAVIFLAGVAVVISRDHREAPWAVLLTGFAVLALLSIHELAPAALVAAAVAGTVGQRWYQKTYPQEYTTKPSEVLFSRAGRAVTVFSFALLGFLIVTDRLPTRNVLGTGFASDFQTTITALDEQLSQLPEDARVLHTRADTGDYLIWSGRRSFIDSRITPFGPADDPESVNQLFRTLRRNMVETSTAAAAGAAAQQQIPQAGNAAGQDGSADSSQPPDDGDFTASLLSGDVPESGVPEQDPDETAAVLFEGLERLDITHAVTGFYPPESPHIRSTRALGSDPETWTLTSVESSAAVFQYTKDLAPADRPEAFNTRKRAFEDITPDPVQRFEFARPRNFYDRYLYRTRPTAPVDMRIARNYLNMRPTPDNLMVALRAANRLVAEDDQNAQGFMMQALAYSRLITWEAQVSSQAGGKFPADMRY